MAKESINFDESSSTSSRPTTLLLRTNRPYFYNTWIVNNRLRIANQKSFQRQQSSCSCAFYSLCLSVIAAILLIVIYRFTDQCSSIIINWKELSQICHRYWLFFAASFISLISFCAFLVAICRYFRSQGVYFTYGDENTSRIMTPHYYNTPVLLENGSSMDSSRNHSPQRKIPPFIYDELPSEATSIRISISPPMDFDHCQSSARTSISNKSQMDEIYLKTPSNIWQKRSIHS